MKLFKILLTALAILFAAQASYAAVGLNVVLSEQTPDPVAPGNFVFVTVKISNTGTENVDNAVIRFMNDEYFRIANGERSVINVGTIPAFSGAYDTTEGFVNARFKVLVDDQTPTGLNELSIRVETTQGTFDYDLDVLVQDQNPRLQVNSFDISQTGPGEIGTLKLEVENINPIQIKDVFVTLDLDAVEDNVISMARGTNERVISRIEPGEKASMEFELVVSPDADAKPYLLPFNITFEDTQDATYIKTLTGTVSVYSNPIVTVDLDSQEVYTEGKGRVTLAIANPGTSTVKGTRLELLEGENYEVIEGDFQYIGDLNPDDFQTIQGEVFIDSTDEAVLNVRLSYLDSYNEEIIEIVEIPLKVYNREELQSYGLVSGGGGSSFGSIILIIIVGALAFYIGRRMGIKKGKKLAKKK